MVDYPNSKKAKKVFLCLFVGGGMQHVPTGLEGEEEATETARARLERRRERVKKMGRGEKKKRVKDKTWIFKKKEVMQTWPSAHVQ